MLLHAPYTSFSYYFASEAANPNGASAPRHEEGRPEGELVADRKPHKRMTHAEQIRRSQSRYGSSAPTGAPSHARTASETPRTSRRASSTSTRHIATRADGVDAYAARRKKKDRRYVLRGVLVALLLALVGVGTAAALYITQINNNLSDGVSEELRQQLVSVEPQQPFYMLLLGVDKSEGRAEEWGDSTANFRADTIILARVDAPAQKVTLVSIPRDTYVDMGSHGKDKINAAYSYGGAAYMVEVVSEFAGVDISAYAEIDFEQFTSIVDTIGGIEVTLPVDVVDEDYAGINLSAGTHQLDGATALALVRTRHAYDSYGGGDFYRAANQRAVIAAIVKKILQQDPVTMASTVSKLADSVTTTMGVTDIVSLAMQFRNLDVDNDFYSGQTPTISEYTNNIWYEMPDTAAWKEMMQRVDAGESPYSDASQDFTSDAAIAIGDGTSISDGDGTSSSGEKATYSGSVLVLNGTGVSGLAASKSSDLESAGFSPYADTANSSSHTTSMVYYNGSSRSSAIGVAETLGISTDNVAENTEGYSTKYDVIVVLGADQSN